MILFFSGCGNSRFVANELGLLTSLKVCQINPLDKTPEYVLADNEPLGIVCPVYAWSVPRLVNDYMLRLKLNANPSYIFLACTCGDNVGRTPERFNAVLQRRGWHLDAAFSFIMPETYINLPGFNLDTQQDALRKINATRQRLALVAKRIVDREHLFDVVRGPVPRLTSGLANPIFYGLLITDRKFHANDTCSSCGLCAEVCPLKNISLNDGHPRWHGNCTNCMACYHHCPSNAIHFGKATVGKGQYTFKDDSLK